MATIEQDIEVDVPVRTAYDQWTQFEDFPRFMDGVQAVQQLDDAHLHWVARIGGVEKEWDAEITAQEPDRVIAWRSTDGAWSAGTVVFEPVDPSCTRIRLRMEWEPAGFIESAGSALGLDAMRVRGDLMRFKELVEERGTASGGWRGEVHGGVTEAGSTTGPASGAIRTGAAGGLPDEEVRGEGGPGDAPGLAGSGGRADEYAARRSGRPAPAEMGGSAGADDVIGEAPDTSAPLLTGQGAMPSGGVVPGTGGMTGTGSDILDDLVDDVDARTGDPLGRDDVERRRRGITTDPETGERLSEPIDDRLDEGLA